MSFLCPVRVGSRGRKKDETMAPLRRGRITGSDSLETLAQVQAAKEAGSKVRMIVIQDFHPCVEDELQVQRGQKVSVLFQENDWLYVTTEDSREGFIPYNYCLPQERSIDDFAKIVKLEHAVKKRHTDSFKRALDISNSKSMPDIAKNCQPNTSGDAQHHNVHEAKTKDASNSPNLDNQGPVEWPTQVRGRRHERRLASQQETKPRTQSLDRTDWETPMTRVEKPTNSSYKQFVQQHNMRRGHQPQRSSFHGDYSNHATYVNEDFAKDIRKSTNHVRSKPDVLPPTPADSQDGGSVRASVISTSSSRPSTTSSSTRKHQGNIDDPRSSNATTTRNSKIPGHSMQRDCQQTPDVTHVVTFFYKVQMGKYISLYDFRSRQENDINIREGDVLALLNKDDPDWFWVQNSAGREGFVPSNHIKKLDDFETGAKSRQFSNSLEEKDKSIVESHPDQGQRQAHQSSMRQLKEAPTDKQIDILKFTKLVCVYNYTAQMQDDLTITRGDILYADFSSKKHSDGWIWVYSQTRRSGYVPRSYIKAPNFGLVDYPGSDSVRNVRVFDGPVLTKQTDSFISR